MKIELSKKQYGDLIVMSAISSGIFGILGDVFIDTNYKKCSEDMDRLEKHLLSYAKDFGHSDLVEIFEGEEMLDDEFYEHQIMPILDDYEDFALYDRLAIGLAKRDFRRDHTEAEIRKMTKKNDGYFGVDLHGYEKKYQDEFDKHGYDRLEITDSKAKKLYWKRV